MKDPETVEIPLVNRRGDIIAHALVDAEDAAWVLKHTWGTQRSSTGHLYARRYERSYPVFLHREILGLPTRGHDLEADHISRNTLDNRRANLRVVTHAQNMQNRSAHRGGRSRYRGVYWHQKDRRWHAEIRLNGRRVWLATFRDEEAAGIAAAEARQRLLTHAVD